MAYNSDMDDEQTKARIWLFGVLLGAVVATIITSEVTNNLWRAEAHKAGHAEYSAGLWQWKGSK